MFKILLVSFMLVRATWGRPRSLAPTAAQTAAPGMWAHDVVVWRQDVPWNGSFYSYRFLTLLGVYRQEEGRLKKNDEGRTYLDVNGVYSYASPDGLTRRVGYHAGDGGYREVGITSPNMQGAFPENEIMEQPSAQGKERKYARYLKKNDCNPDRITLSDNYEENRIDCPDNDLTTITVPSTPADAYNTIDEDDVANRMGGLPPAVISSLLGG